MIVSAPCILDVEAAEPPGLASLGIRRGGVVTADGRLKNLPELQTVGGRTAVAQLRSDDSKLSSGDPTPLWATARRLNVRIAESRAMSGYLTATAAASAASSSLSDNLSYRTDLSLPGGGGVGFPKMVDAILPTAAAEKSGSAPETVDGSRSVPPQLACLSVPYPKARMCG